MILLFVISIYSIIILVRALLILSLLLKSRDYKFIEKVSMINKCHKIIISSSISQCFTLFILDGVPRRVASGHLPVLPHVPLQLLVLLDAPPDPALSLIHVWMFLSQPLHYLHVLQTDLQLLILHSRWLGHKHRQGWWEVIGVPAFDVNQLVDC